MQIHAEHDDTMKTSEAFFKKIYTSHFIERLVCERELETKENSNILTPTFMAIGVVPFLFSRVAHQEARGPSFLYHTCLQLLVSKLTDFLSSPSYILVQRPPYLWSGRFDRHPAEITVMQFTGHSLPVHHSMAVPWDFNPVPYCQPDSHTPMEYALPPSLEWHVLRGRRSIYYKCKQKTDV